jgi:hypothetical protein
MTISFADALTLSGIERETHLEHARLDREAQRVAANKRIKDIYAKNPPQPSVYVTPTLLASFNCWTGEWYFQGNRNADLERIFLEGVK